MSAQYKNLTLFTAQVVAAAGTANSPSIDTFDLDDMALWLQFTQVSGSAGTFRFNFQGSKDGTNFYDIIGIQGAGAGTAVIFPINFIAAYNDATFVSGRIIPINSYFDNPSFLLSIRPLASVRAIRLQAINNSTGGTLTCSAELWGRKISGYA